MKYIILVVTIAAGIILGIYPGLRKKLPTWWKFVLIIAMAIDLALVYLPPTAGRIDDLKTFNPRQSSTSLDILFRVAAANDLDNNQAGTLPVTESDGDDHVYSFSMDPNNASGAKLSAPGELAFANVTYQRSDSSFTINRVYAANPLMTYSLVPLLLENVRIINLHVPVAWVSVLGYVMALIFSIRYLRTRNLEDDLVASSAASLGTVFCVMTTVTGMVWAKSNWGAFWNWDPRETSIFILLVIYLAYFALRIAIDKEELRARLSAVYSIITFVAVPFLIFILPRMASGLHPGSGGAGGSSSPILGAPGDTMGTMKLAIFGFSFFCFTMLYFWLLRLNIRVRSIHINN